MPSAETGLITGFLPSLIGGVSQQPHSLRIPEQAEESINALASITEGLLKRPNTEFVANLSDAFGSLSDTAFVHSYARDPSERYVVVVIDGDLKVYNLIDGSEVTVSFPDGKGYLDVSSDPAANFRAVTIGDFTFLVNRTVTVDDTATTSASDPFEALVWIRMGDYGTEFSLTLDGTTYTHKTDPQNRSEITTEFIAQALLTKIPTGKDLGVIHLGTATDYAIGDVLTATLTGDITLSADYTVQADKNDSAFPESLHAIAQGLAHAINQDDDAVGEVRAYPVFQDEEFSISDGVIIVGLSTDDSFTVGISSTGDADVTATNQGTQAETYEVERIGSTLHISRVNNADFDIKASDGLGDQGMEIIKGQIQQLEDLPATAVDGFKVEVTGDPSSEFDNYYVIYQDSGSVENEGVWVESLKGNELTTLDASTMPHTLVRQANGTFVFQEATWATRLVGDLTSAPFPSFLGFTIQDVAFFKNRLIFVSQENVIASSAGEFFNFFRKSIIQLLDEDIIDVSLSGERVAIIRSAVPHEDSLVLFADNAQFPLRAPEGELFTASTVFPGPATSFDSAARVKPTALGNDLVFASDRTATTGVYRFFTVSASDQNKDAEELTTHVVKYLRGKPLDIAASEDLNMVAVATLSEKNKLYVYKFHQEQSQLFQKAWASFQFGDSTTEIVSVDFIETRLILVLKRGDAYTLEVLDLAPGLVDTTVRTLLDIRMDEDTATPDFSDGDTTWTLPLDLPEANNTVSVVNKSTLEEYEVTRNADDTVTVEDEDLSETPVWIGVKYELSHELTKLFYRSGNIPQTDLVTKIRDLHLEYKGTGFFTVEVKDVVRDVTFTYTFDGDTDDESGNFRVPVVHDNEGITITIKSDSPRPATFQAASFRAYISKLTVRG
jgi:hypothetical protein